MSSSPADRIAALYAQAEVEAKNAFNPSIPLNRYFRSLHSMKTIGEAKTRERQFSHAYLIQVKMTILFIKHLKQHPEYQSFSKSNPAEILKARKYCSEALSTAEIVKQQLMRIFAAEEVQLQKRLEKERFEAEAAQAKTELWELEAERRKLEEESQNPQPPIEEENKPIVPSRTLKPVPQAPQSGLKVIEPKNSIQSNLVNVAIPQQLSTQFLRFAAPNSEKNIETCGLLFGMTIDSALEVTHCLIPQQKGTHDSCVTTKEEQILDFQDKHTDLIMLGWIHTHPDYNAFLSSVDMHNHYLYQCMMPESIAVVVSPKFNEVGTFNLTEHGMRTMSSCSQTGFHPHSNTPPLFEPARHVRYVQQRIEFCDWRAAQPN